MWTTWKILIRDLLSFVHVTYSIYSLHCLVVPAWDLDILDDSKRKLIDVFAVRLLDLIGRRIVSDCCPHVIATRKEGIEDFGSNVSRTTGDKYGLSDSGSGASRGHCEYVGMVIRCILNERGILLQLN